MSAQDDIRMFKEALDIAGRESCEGPSGTVLLGCTADELAEVRQVAERIAQREANGRLDRAQGCLVGGAVGDALGYPVEFMSYEEIQERFGAEGIRGYWLDHTGGMALFSDDTQMTLFTAAGLLEGDTRMHLRGIAGTPAGYIYRAYLDWLHTQDSSYTGNPGASFLVQVDGLHSRRAPGNTCLSALCSGKMGTMEHPLNDSKGCGGVMRVAPVGVFFGATDHVVRDAAEAAAITHGHPLGYIPAGALAYVVGECMAHKRALDDIVRDCIAQLPGWFPQQETYARKMADQLSYARHLACNEECRQQPDHDSVVLLGEGWVGDEALAIAVYCCLRHPDSFDEAVIAAVNHGGDSDSTGAIAGNIMGAYLGLSAIGAQWTKQLELRDVILEVAKDLCDGCQMSEFGHCRDRRWLAKWGGSSMGTLAINDLLCGNLR